MRSHILALILIFLVSLSFKQIHCQFDDYVEENEGNVQVSTSTEKDLANVFKGRCASGYYHFNGKCIKPVSGFFIEFRSVFCVFYNSNNIFVILEVWMIANLSKRRIYSNITVWKNIYNNIKLILFENLCI